jgi:hypothetical protein
MMRELSESFLNDLISPEGKLHPIITRVKSDQTLMLAIRDGFINIYYRGCDILRLTETRKEGYSTFFDNTYNKSGHEMPDSPARILNTVDANKWVDSFLLRKRVLDEFLSAKGHSEKEFQQLVARENNTSTISNESEYFISRSSL